MNEEQNKFDALKKEVLDSTDLRRMYQMMIDLTEDIASLHGTLIKTEDQVERVKWKGVMSVKSTLLHIVEKRIDDVRELEADKLHKTMVANLRFRMAAEAVLKPETIQKIKDTAALNYKQFKELKPSLKKDILE